jgi:arylsulfatase
MRNYNALISNVDDAAREIVDELKRQGLYERTLIIFTCDNGMMLGRHGLGGKWHPFEESIRVPLIIHDPRMPLEKRGTLDDHFTLNVDLAETILGAAGLEPGPKMQGRDIADLYLEERTSKKDHRPWRHDFFYEFPLHDVMASSALVTKKYKYMKFERKGGIEQLFDLEKDPYELNNLMMVMMKNASSDHDVLQAEILPQLKERYRQLKEEAVTTDGIMNVPKCEKGRNP